MENTTDINSILNVAVVIILSISLRVQLGSRHSSVISTSQCRLFPEGTARMRCNVSHSHAYEPALNPARVSVLPSYTNAAGDALEAEFCMFATNALCTAIAPRTDSTCMLFHHKKLC